eukprot:7451688-Pyramimonas_sp.AAC.1
MPRGRPPCSMICLAMPPRPQQSSNPSRSRMIDESSYHSFASRTAAARTPAAARIPAALFCSEPSQCMALS